MTFKQKLVKIIGPESAKFQVLYQIRHPIKTARKWKMILRKSSIFDDEDDLHGCSLLPLPLLKGTVDFINPASVLDVGCGSGKSLDWFLGRGIEVVGLEGSSMGIAHAKTFNAVSILSGVSKWLNTFILTSQSISLGHWSPIQM